MKGAFHAGPTIDPLFQMYLTARKLAMRGTNGVFTLTLVVGNSYEEKCQDNCPAVHSVKEAGDDAIEIQLRDLVGDFCIGRGRHEAGVDRHGEQCGERRTHEEGEVKTVHKVCRR